MAVPAMAAQGTFGFANAAPAQPAPTSIAPMPFEQRGGSFPGSAFYYLEDAPRLAHDFEPPATAPGAGDRFNPVAVMSGDPAQAVEIETAGPAARAFRAGGSGTDRARALQCLATAVYYEAASESIGGQKAVAQVVLNRVAHPTYPRSVCGVVYQGSERRTGCQFSFTCDGSLRRKPSVAGWARALGVANRALSGEVYAPVGHATHYHTTWVNPYWAPSLDFLGTIGAHRFYRWKGAAGQPDAFRTAYIGGEPLPRPKATLAPAVEASIDAPSNDPVALARAYEEAKRKAEANHAPVSPRASAIAGPPPRYAPQVEAAGGDALFTADRLPGAGAVKPEFANAGKWKE